MHLQFFYFIGSYWPIEHTNLIGIFAKKKVTCTAFIQCINQPTQHCLTVLLWFSWKKFWLIYGIVDRRRRHSIVMCHMKTTKNNNLWSGTHVEWVIHFNGFFFFNLVVVINRFVFNCCLHRMKSFLSLSVLREKIPLKRSNFP